MPTTSDGETVYTPPAEVAEYVQTDPATFSLSTTADPDDDGASEWVEFLETIQVAQKQRIDEFCGRDFEDHTGDTVTLGGGRNASRYVDLPYPVQAISEVRVDGDVVDAANYRLLKGAGQLLRLDDDGDESTWETGWANIDVDLDWGYSTPPADVQEAEKKMVANTVIALGQQREGVVVQQDDASLRVSMPSAMTSEIRAILGEHSNSTPRGEML